MNMEALVKEVYGPGVARSIAARWPSDRPRRIRVQPPKPRQEVLSGELPWRERLEQFRKMLDDKRPDV